jgi:16S rRNA A1518/A1519 N6-dimethyltransferase RsmA/KsgA/DIM1 with predicted DNA glycosylase/AP lyase activity
MVGWSSLVDKGVIAKAWPWSTCAPGTTICDVGGGNGHGSLELVNKYPHLKVIIQDRPAVIQQAKEFWEQERLDLVQSSVVRFQEIDFMKDPPVESCDVYYVRHIL